MSTFPALIVREPGPASFEELSEADLPEGDVTVGVQYSSLNYKDGLAVTGQGRIARRFPMVCGIDLAGIVEASDAPSFAVGDEVVLTGWGLSETHPGGFTRRQRVRSEWLVHRPEPLSLLQTMAIGTAGLTAMLCITALENAGLVNTDDNEILVTGAGGGVGSVAVALLAVLGHRVTASTGRPELHDYLGSLGASTIIDRNELSDARPAARHRAMGWRSRYGWQPDPLHRAVASPVRRRGGGLWTGRRQRPSWDRPALHPPQRQSVGDRLGPVPEPAPHRGVAAARLRVAADAARRDHLGRPAQCRARLGDGHRGGEGKGSRGDRHSQLTESATGGGPHLARHVGAQHRSSR